MHASTHRSILIPALLALACSSALANGKHPRPEPKPPADPAPWAEATSSSESSADAAASARSGAEQSQHAEATGGQGIGTVTDSTRVRSLGIALSVPGATAAPAVIDACIEHSRGWQAGFGAAARSGGTKLQAKCAERQHCLAIADRYVAMGLPQAAVDQLATCGGVKFVVLPPVADSLTAVPSSVSESTDSAAAAGPPDMSGYVKRDELERFATKEQVDRAFRLGISK